MLRDILELRDQSNAELLEGIRHDASMDYQNRIPDATRVGMREVMEALDDYRPHWNEFLNGFVNRIGSVIARSNSWQNPLAVFKKGLLTYGDTVEEYMADMLEAYSYDPDRDYGEKILLSQERPSVEVNYHRVNRQDMYKVTVNEKMLRRAFLNEGGLSQLINEIMASALKSDQYDEFLLMSQLFAEYDRNGGFFKIQTPNFTGLNLGEAEARQALKQIRDLSYRLPILSRTYNAAGMPVSANPEDLVLIGTPEFLASIDVDGLAPIFHLPKAQITAERMIGIPSEYMGIESMQGILTSKDFFMVFDTLFENRLFDNPAGLYTNFFLHHHQIVSASRFVPAILLTSDSGTIVVRDDFEVNSVTSIVVTDRDENVITDLVRGTIYDVDATVATTPANKPVGLAWSVTGNGSTHTYVTTEGVLYVAPDEPSATITLTAHTVSTDPSNPRLAPKSVSRIVNVTGDINSDWPRTDGELYAITVAGVNVPSVAPETLTYAITLPPDTTVTDDDVQVWTKGTATVSRTITFDDEDDIYTIVINLTPRAGVSPIVYTVTATILV